MWELDAEDRGLQRVQSEVAAHQGVGVFRLRAVAAELAYALGQVGVVGRHHAAVAVAAQVLRREEAEAAHISQRARPTAFVFGADRLRGIFDNHEGADRSQVQQRIHICHLSEQMDGENHARPRREGSLHVAGVEIIGVGVYVHEDGLRP